MRNKHSRILFLALFSVLIFSWNLPAMAADAPAPVAPPSADPAQTQPAITSTNLEADVAAAGAQTSSPPSGQQKPCLCNLPQGNFPPTGPLIDVTGANGGTPTTTTGAPAHR